MKLLTAKPDETGLDSDRLLAASQIISDALEAGQFSGAAYIIGRNGRIIEPTCFGFTTPERLTKITPDTIFDIASLTKPVATAASIIKLIELGKISLEQELEDFISVGPNERLAKVTLRQLLGHVSGLPAYLELKPEIADRDLIISAILKSPLQSAPGSNYVYSCPGYVLLSEVVRCVSGTGLADFSFHHFFKPLGMVDTCFGPEKSKLERTAATTSDLSQIGKVHDPIARKMGGVSGNAGLFSTVMDLARFTLMLLKKGDGVISEKEAELVFTNLNPNTVAGYTAGWFIYPNDMLPAGDMFSKVTIGHTGFTGVSIVIDPEIDLFIILLTNRVCMPNNSAEFQHTRRKFNNTVAQAVIS